MNEGTVSVPGNAIEEETEFTGPLSEDQLVWVGLGLLGILLALAIRDFIFARKRWTVPVLTLFRLVAFAGILLALAAPTRLIREHLDLEKRVVAIYLDSSASMRLRDPFDGNGHLIHWKNPDDTDSLFSRMESFCAKLATSRALLTQDFAEARLPHPLLKELGETLDETTRALDTRGDILPYPALCKELIDRYQQTIQPALRPLVSASEWQPSLEEPSTVLLDEIDEWYQRLSVISAELARKEEQVAMKSQGSRDRPSRFELASNLLKTVEAQTLSNLSDKLIIDRFHFSDSIRSNDAKWSVAPDPRYTPNSDQEQPTPGTDLNTLLQRLSGDFLSEKIDAALVITDAVHFDPGSPDLRVPSELRGHPVFLIPSGGDYRLDDVILWDTESPPTMTIGDFLTIDCLVGARGFPNADAVVKLVDDQGAVLDRKQVTFGTDEEDLRVQLTTRVERAGEHRFEISIDPMEGELFTENNREWITVDVFSGDLDVLLVDGWPRWETRYLTNLLRRDADIDHREILFAPEPDTVWPGLITSADRLHEFEVIIIGEVGPEYLGVAEIAALESYVNEGGNLVIIAGKEFMPTAYNGSRLADILPVYLDRERLQGDLPLQLQPTASGRRVHALSLEDEKLQNDAVWIQGSSLMPMIEMSTFNVPKPGAQVILEASPVRERGPSIPYLAWHRYGSGRAFYFSAPISYHLRYRFGDRYHYRFWGQFFRWATVAETRGNGLIDLTAHQKRYREGETARFTLELRSTDGSPITREPVQLEIARLEGSPLKLQTSEVPGKPGIYEGALPGLKRGEYRITAVSSAIQALLAELEQDPESGFAAPETRFVVESAPNPEEGDHACDWDNAARIVEGSLGSLLSPLGVPDALELLANYRAGEAPVQTSREPLWNRWPLFLFILLFLAADWAGRKYAGLI